ncbi:two-component sensor histidine kinase [Sesbania bispinosa]|nr:two-component sensor histidine kinase [Sesbania bispinosa]
MPEKLYISGKLLRELAVRWDDVGRISSKKDNSSYYAFECMFCMGLRIVGEKVVLDGVGDSESRTKGHVGVNGLVDRSEFEGELVDPLRCYEKRKENYKELHNWGDDILKNRLMVNKCGLTNVNGTSG